MRLMKPILFAVFVIGAFFVMGILAESAHAVPPFAKKYGTSCNTCHIAPPKLNGFGNAFRLNGYFWPGKNGAKDDDAARKIKAFEIGKAHFKPLGGNRATLDMAPLIGFWTQIDLSYTPKRADSSSPVTTLANFSLDFMFAGTLGDSISYFNIMATDAGASPALEVLYVNFLDIGVKNLLNIRLGRVLRGPVTAHSADTLNYKKSHYNSGDMLALGSTATAWNMAQGGSGADIWGFTSFGKSSIGYQLSLISDFANTVDDNYQKTFYGFLEYQFGGVRWGDGGGKLHSLSVRVRGFGAVGTKNDGTSAAPINSKNTAFGGELEVGVAGFELLGYFIYQKQKLESASGTGSYSELKTTFFGVEAAYELAGGSIIPVVRWEKSSPKLTTASGATSVTQGRHFLDFAILFQIRPNVQIKPGVTLELNAKDVNKFEANGGSHKTLKELGVAVNYGF